jgi:acetyltransferase-like isoleucine patch superfamily enzyme
MIHSVIGAVERLLIRSPRWSVPPFVAEALARGLAVVAGLMNPADRLALEARLRGVLLSSRFRARDLRVGRLVTFEGWENISLGDGVSLYGSVFLNATGDKGRIRVGPGTHIDRNTVLYGQGGVDIGAGCAVASGVIVYSQSNQYSLRPGDPILDQGTRYAPVSIGDDVWIGAGAIILPGVKIGDHAVVAAGSVIRADVEDWNVVAGVPARMIRDRRAVT